MDEAISALQASQRIVLPEDPLHILVFKVDYEIAWNVAVFDFSFASIEDGQFRNKYRLLFALDPAEQLVVANVVNVVGYRIHAYIGRAGHLVTLIEILCVDGPEERFRVLVSLLLLLLLPVLDQSLVASFDSFKHGLVP